MWCMEFSTDRPVFRRVNEAGSSALVLICDHASNRIPRDYDDFGIAQSDLTRHIAWDVAQRLRGSMRENHGGTRDPDRCRHRFGRRMREVDQHSQAVHLAHHFLSEGGKSAMAQR